MFLVQPVAKVVTSLAVANSALFFIFVLFVVVRKITFEGRKKNEKIIPGRHKKSHPGATPETNFFLRLASVVRD